MTFNLDPPPHFCGLDFDGKIRFYARNLPHWRQDGATYFVTFNLADALPGPKRDQLKSMRRQWEQENPLPRDEATWEAYGKSVFRSIEKWMDAGYGACWFRTNRYANELHRSILHFHNKRYEIGCFVLMANHCHLLIRPLESYVLEDEIGSIKRVTARFIDRNEQTTGSLWQQEFYDRIVRDEEHLYRVVQYIGDNPRRAGIHVSQWKRWINPVWQAAGWDFEDRGT